VSIEIAVVAEPPEVEIRLTIWLDHADEVIVDLDARHSAPATSRAP
jgi:hypothetical protein